MYVVTVPSNADTNVCDSFDNIVWIGEVPSEPSAPSVPSLPSVPAAPPSTLNTLTLSVSESLLTDIVIGKFAFVEFKPPLLSAPLNVILPLTIPLPADTLFVSKVYPVTLPPCAVVIVISEDEITPDRFCWVNENIISVGVAVVSDGVSNPNTWESTLAINVFAFVPSTPSAPGSPSTPCLDLAKDIVLGNDTLSDVAVIITEPLSCVIPVIVIVLPLIVEVTPVLLVLLKV